MASYDVAGNICKGPTAVAVVGAGVGVGGTQHEVVLQALLGACGGDEGARRRRVARARGPLGRARRGHELARVLPLCPMRVTITTAGNIPPAEKVREK